MSIFLKKDRTILVTMIQAHTAERVFELIDQANKLGTDAFGLQLEQLEHQYRDEATLKSIFAAMGDKPCYVTNYRFGLNQGMSDEELAKGLLHAVRCGGTLVDVMGDYFDKSEEQLTEDEVAVRKQMELIEKIHAAGGEVLMSSHTLHYMPKERVLYFMEEQQRRGADVAKIVTASANEDELDKNLEISMVLKTEKTLPTLFLSIGDYCRKHRMFGPFLSDDMFLCVVEHDELATINQPLLADAIDISELLKVRR